MSKWAIKAVFRNEAGQESATYYEEKTYRTKRQALKAINDQEGEEIAQGATLDCKIEGELAGYWLDDLEVYKVKEGVKC